ncbi:MAG: homoserine dehydrogenase [Desulfobacteraceae bacterium]
MKKINIGILGCGVVGTGVAKLLLEKKELLSSRTGALLNLKRVADPDIKRERDVSFEEGMLVSDANLILNDPEIDIVVELIGGKTVAREYTIRALENGKHVVTANKALLSSHGNEIVKVARTGQVDLAFEASVGGCMPIIKTMRESLIANNIRSISAILNGTCNYILTRISKHGDSFEKALKTAQEKGFAEAEPSLDIDGHDSAHKLAILNSLAHGIDINLEDIHVEGISRIKPIDIKFAANFGYDIKLLAISKARGDQVEARVHPTMIPLSNPLAHVGGVMNAVAIDADETGPTMLYGHGAGMMPTASAVISDIADIARNLIVSAKRRVPILGYPEDNIKKADILPMKDLATRYYIRCSAMDNPGVLSRISGILGDLGISIESVHQKGKNANGAVPVVMITHMAKEENVVQAIDGIRDMDSIPDKPVLIRIEDNSNQE